MSAVDAGVVGLILAWLVILVAHAVRHGLVATGEDLAGIVENLGDAIARAGNRVAHGRRPHRVDKPVQNWTTPPALPPEWGTHAAALERVPAGVRDEFVLPDERVGRWQEFATGGVLILSDGASLPPGLPDGAAVIRGGDPAGVRFIRNGMRAAHAREAARIRREAYQQLLRTRAASQPKPVSHRTRGPHGTVDVRAAVPVQDEVPAPPPRGRSAGGHRGAASPLPRARPIQSPARGPSGGSGQARAQ